jgi:Domain of unknown function (DUF1993)
VWGLASAELLTFANTEANIPDLKERIAKTIDFIKGLKPTQIDSTEDKEITIKFTSGERKFTRQLLLLNFSLPNFCVIAASSLPKATLSEPRSRLDRRTTSRPAAKRRIAKLHPNDLLSCPVQSTPIALPSAASVIANPTTSMTVVSLLRISDKLSCDFPLGLSGIKNRGTDLPQVGEGTQTSRIMGSSVSPTRAPQA